MNYRCNVLTEPIVTLFPVATAVCPTLPLPKPANGSLRRHDAVSLVLKEQDPSVQSKMDVDSSYRPGS